jgi:hypothetical protein
MLLLNLEAFGPWDMEESLLRRPGRRDVQHFECSKINIIDRTKPPLSIAGLVRFWDMACTEGAVCSTVGPLDAKKGNKYFAHRMKRER